MERLDERVQVDIDQKNVGLGEYLYLGIFQILTIISVVSNTQSDHTIFDHKVKEYLKSYLLEGTNIKTE